MAGEVVVRPARVDDADAIAAVHVRAWQDTYRGAMPDDFLDGMSIEERALRWRDGLSAGADDRATLVAVDALVQRGCTEAYLWVVQANARARRFYEREGWAPDGVVKDSTFGGRSVREVRYRRGLSAASC